MEVLSIKFVKKKINEIYKLKKVKNINILKSKGHRMGKERRNQNSENERKAKKK